MGDKDAARAALAATLTEAYRVLRQGATLCVADNCDHGLNKRHGLLLSVNNVPDFLLQHLEITSNQAKVVNNLLGKLGLRSSTAKGAGKFVHVVNMGRRTIITPEMVAALDDPVVSSDTASTIGQVAVKAANVEVEIPPADEAAQQPVYPPVEELRDFVGQVDVLLQENEDLRRENADLRRRVAELTPYAELAREMHDTLHADRG